MHVVKAPWVGSVLPDIRRSLQTCTIAIVGVIGILCSQFVAKGEGRRSPRSAGVLPFRFCGQLISHTRRQAPSLALQFGKLLAERHHVVPRHFFHGTVRSLELVRVASHHLLPLGLRHLVLAEVETARQSHRVRGFIIATTRLRSLATHLERPRLHPKHLHGQIGYGERGGFILLNDFSSFFPPHPTISRATNMVVSSFFIPKPYSPLPLGQPINHIRNELVRWGLY
jgi:hypothetical protein